MLRSTFELRLRQGALRALRFGQTMLEERLPESLRFQIQLNASYDGNPLHADERVFPEDASRETASRLHASTLEEVLDVLWRDGSVPEWVNLSVAGVLSGHTVIETVVCGRFTANEALLYHQQEGRSPFHVVGPTLPVDYREGERFSVYDRPVCWTRPELEQLHSVADRVWSLTLHGADIDDAALAALPPMPRLALLELQHTAVAGAALGSLDRHPQLRLLRGTLAEDRGMDVGQLPAGSRIDHIDLTNLPTADWGFSRLLKRVPALRHLSLRSEYDLALPGRLPPEIERIELAAPNAHGLRLPTHLESLSLRLAQVTDEGLVAMLDGLHSLRALDLRGTPVADDVVEPLPGRLGLTFLDVVDTNVTQQCRDRIASAHPTLRLLPRAGS